MDYHTKHKNNLLKQDAEKKTLYLSVFCFTMFAVAIVFFVMSVLTHGYASKSIFFEASNDTFMDHFNSVIYNAEDPYENHVIYPPLATLSYKLLYKMIPQSGIDQYVVNSMIKSQPKEIRIEPGYAIQFAIFSTVTILGFIIALDLLKKGSKKEKLLFIFACIFSTPFLYMLERGNNIIVALLFSAIFVAYYDSDSKVLRELALVSLAIATGFKIYPVAFGVLLLRNRKYKELVRTAIYCVITTIVPFYIFYNGTESIMNMIRCMSGFGEARASVDKIDASLNFKLMFRFVTGVLRIPVSDMDGMGNLFRLGLTALCVLCTLFADKDWKAALLCSCIIYGFQSTCSTYLIVMFIIPLCMLIDTEKKNNTLTYIYLLLLTLAMCLLVLPDPNEASWTRYIPTKLSSLAILGLTCLCCCDSIVNLGRMTAGLAKRFREKVINR